MTRRGWRHRLLTSMSSIAGRHRLLIVLSFIIYHLSFSPAGAQTVSMQAALNDSTFFNVRLRYTTADGGTVTMKSAYITRRGTLKPTPVETTALYYEFDKTPTVSFGFSTGFTFDRRRYRVQGRYAQGDTDGPECVLRCVPMRLSDKTLRESEYSPALR